MKNMYAWCTFTDSYLHLTKYSFQFYLFLKESKTDRLLNKKSGFVC